MRSKVRSARVPVRRGVALALALALWAGGVFVAHAAPQATPPPDSEAVLAASQGLDSYEIEAKLNPEQRTLECVQRVRYTNRSKETLSTLYFHAYANVFKREETSPAADSELAEKTYPRGFDPGEIAFASVKLDGRAVAFALQGADEAVLRVPVDLLEPGEAAALELVYTLRVPVCNYRFGRGERDIWNLGNAFPIAAVYENGEWRLDPYGPIGDPFYSACANYRVTVDAPEGFEIAASGALRGKEKTEGRFRWTFEIPAAREFALSFSQGYKAAQAFVDGALVQAYASSAERAKRILELAKGALGIYNEMLAQYPYASVSVVESPLGGYGGMEYPGLVMIDSAQFESGGMLEYVVAHELAHQWWYAQVGSDEVRSPWLDEALTEYTALRYFARAHGQEAFDRLYEQRVESAMRLTLPADRTVAADIDRFASLWEYGMVVYCRGAGMLHGIYLAVGEETFLRALRTYLDAFRFKTATREDLIRVFNEVTGSDWQGYFDDYLDGSFS